MVDCQVVSAGSRDPRWRLGRRLLLRRAGFGVDLWCSLAHDATLSSAARYRHAVQELETARSRALDTVVKQVATAAAGGDRARLRALSRLRSKIGRRLDPGSDGALLDLTTVLDPYRRCVRAAAEADATLVRDCADEVADRGRRLAPIVADSRIRDAILQLAPSVHAELLRWTESKARRAPRAKDRAFHRRLYLYVQRLAAKNETTSFFGPLVHGRVDQDVTGVVLGAETETRVPRNSAGLEILGG